jgi:Mg2+/Co2+ transporter CorC
MILSASECVQMDIIKDLKIDMIKDLIIEAHRKAPIEQEESGVVNGLLFAKSYWEYTCN